MPPCQHCFCYNCIDLKKGVCPVCNERFRPDDLKRNLKLEQILEQAHKTNANQSKPSGESYPKNFKLGGQAGSQQRTAQREETDWLPTVIAGGACLLVGAISGFMGLKAMSAAKRKK
nr:hypothetical transcript [Hymenolepis microstoma]